MNDEDSKPDPLLGTTVDGRYTIERPLAAGGMGSVYLARQRNLARPVAVKVVTNADDELIERFRREAESLAEVSHPAIVEVHDFIRAEEEQGRCYLVMSYVEGEDLEDYLDRVPGGCVPVAEAVALLTPIVSALVQLHANGIVHRDIKPANIIRFQGADGRPAVKLVDFGIARRSVDTSLTSVGYIIGTPPYMAPETLMAKPHTPVADVYAVGATLFELITGAPPFGRGALHEIMGRAFNEAVQIPPHLEGTSLAHLLRQMLVRDEGQRPDALRVLEGLEHIGDEVAAERIAAGGAGLTGPRPLPSGPGVNRQVPTVQITPGSTPAVAVAPPSTLATAALPAPGAPSLSGRQPMTSPGHTDPRLVAGTAPTALARPGMTGVAPLPAGRESESGSRRTPWIWLGPVLVVPVVIAIVTLTLIFGRSDSAPSKKGAVSAEAMERDSAPRERDAAPREGARPREAPEARRWAPAAEARRRAAEDSDWSATRVKELVAACQTHKDAVRLFDTAKTTDRSKAPGAWRKAVAHYKAVLQCAHSSPGQRLWSARLMANIYLRLRDCATMRQMWRTYQQISRSMGKRPKLTPRCR